MESLDPCQTGMGLFSSSVGIPNRDEHRHRRARYLWPVARMCGHYALYGPHSRVREKILLAERPEYAERYSIAPQSTVLIVRFKPGVGRVGQQVRRGLIPTWAKDARIGHQLTIARGETVARKPAFRDSFARHRCIVPSSGFYEWQAIVEAGKSRRQPYYIHPTEPDAYVALAALLAA